jgi:hypothetical protein
MDITMCKNNDCPASLQCFRFRAVPNPDRQSYGEFTTNGDSRCQYFTPIVNPIQRTVWDVTEFIEVQA